MNAPALPAWVVSLPRCADRRAWMEGQMAGSGLDWRFWDATGAEDFRKEDYAAWFAGRYLECPWLSQARGTWALAISHLRLWHHLLAAPTPGGVALVLEDDAEVRPDFARRWAAIVGELPEDWDLVFLGPWDGRCCDERGRHSAHFHRLIRTEAITATHAYVVNTRRLARLLPRVLPLDEELDHHLARRLAGLKLMVHGHADWLARMAGHLPSVREPAAATVRNGAARAAAGAQTRWCVFTTLYRPTPLLGHWVRHYAALGFTDLVVAASPLCAKIDWTALRALVPGATLHVEPLYVGVFDNSRDTGVLNGLKARLIEDRHEWSAVADVDEFYEYPLPLAELAAAAGAANCVEGFFVDRVAANGALPPVCDEVPIAEQFPLETRLTHRVVGGTDRKIMLSRGFQNIRRGHHGMDDERVFPRAGRVHHYKWNADVLAHLGERITDKERTGYQWTHESQRFLDYWQKNGRIVFADCQ